MKILLFKIIWTIRKLNLNPKNLVSSSGDVLKAVPRLTTTYVLSAWSKKYMGNPVYISATIAYMINVYRMNYFFDSIKDSIEETIERTGSSVR